MKSYFTFISNDLKIIFRDKTLILMFFLPIILILVCRFLVPFISGYIPGIENYYWMILAGFCVLSGATPSFLTVFLMLDEKDENLVPVLKTTPLPYSYLIGYRISFLMISSFVFSVIFLIFNGLLTHSFLTILLGSLLVSFIPAILILLILPLAGNKIEGVTLFKGINTILFIPLIAFFIPEDWKYAFGIIPFYWVFDLLQPEISTPEMLKAFIWGLIVNSAYFYLLFLFFNKKFLKKINQ